MQVTFSASSPHGTIEAPPSKSELHRALICASLCDGVSHIINAQDSEDITATCQCIENIGASIIKQGNIWKIGANTHFSIDDNLFPCHNSASTLRFMIPVCLINDKGYTFTGTSTLFGRPFEVYSDIFDRQHILYSFSDKQLYIKGRLTPDKFDIRQNISSQFVSGLLFALPKLSADSTITVPSDMQSRSYIKMTVDMLQRFGIHIYQTNERTFLVPGNQTYRPTDIKISGDWSNAAFFMALKLFFPDISITGLDLHSLQGDKRIVDFLSQLLLGHPTIDIADCPDLAPVLMASAALLNGCTLINTKRLSYKESNRAQAMATELEKFSIQVLLSDNTVRVLPGIVQKPSCPLSSHFDHRIAMAVSILLIKTGGVLQDAQAVCKSFPTFFSCLHRLNTDIFIEHEV